MRWLNTWNGTSATKELNLEFYAVLMILNLNRYMWLMVAVLDSSGLASTLLIFLCKISAQFNSVKDIMTHITLCLPYNVN